MVSPGARKPSVGEGIESRRPLFCSGITTLHSLFIFFFLSFIFTFASILVCVNNNNNKPGVLVLDSASAAASGGVVPRLRNNHPHTTRVLFMCVGTRGT